MTQELESANRRIADLEAQLTGNLVAVDEDEDLVLHCEDELPDRPLCTMYSGTAFMIDDDTVLFLPAGYCIAKMQN